MRAAAASRSTSGKQGPVGTLARCAVAVWLATGLLGGAAGCCKPQVAPFVAVREKRLRTDALALPLSEDTRGQLLAFLEFGGDRAAVTAGVDPVYPDAKERYGPLLTLLSSAQDLEVADLTNGTYARYFQGAPNDQVIDASQDEPPLFRRRLGISDGRFWFVFTLDASNQRLSDLVVFPASRAPTEPES